MKPDRPHRPVRGRVAAQLRGLALVTALAWGGTVSAQEPAAETTPVPPPPLATEPAFTDGGPTTFEALASGTSTLLVETAQAPEPVNPMAVLNQPGEPAYIFAVGPLLVLLLSLARYGLFKRRTQRRST